MNCDVIFFFWTSTLRFKADPNSFEPFPDFPADPQVGLSMDRPVS